jgi:NADPH-dependent 2,4-dienoyl-CoA reductase/sulfur reductase-like enzyme
LSERQLPNGNRSCDVAIVGAGPSGLAAAEVMRDYGLDVILIDEQPRAGGQILRQPPRSFTVEHWLQARLYSRAKSVLQSMDDARDVDWRLGSTVLGIMRHSAYRTPVNRSPGHELWIQGPSGSEVLHASAVLIAPGCYERPLAFPGWTLPGVMGAGAIQGFVKSQQFVPGNRFVLAGSHPLQLVVADQLVAAGADVAAVIFTQQLRAAAAVLRDPLMMAQHVRQLAETARILWRLKRARVPVMFGSTIARVEGKEVVERATVAALLPDGKIDWDRTETMQCDRVGVCHGFLASSELARQAGVTVKWREHEGGWLADHDEWFESSVARLFVAGEITGVAGADAALEKGRIAAVGLLRALGRIDTLKAQRLARTARRRLGRINRFAAALNLLARPPQGLTNATMTDDTTLCRCESISRGEFQRQLRQNSHVVSADAAKLLTRVGMGMCQGRLCGDNAARLIARERGLTPAEVGTFQAQAPVKPIRLDVLCSP